MLLDLPDAETPAETDRAQCGPLAGVAIVVCRSCRLADEPDAATRPGALLVADTRRAAAGSVVVKEAGCLGNCRRGLSAAILRDGCWSYLFGRLERTSGADLVAGARLFAGSGDGFMPYGERPDSLKRGLVGRIPSFASLEDLP